jgi:hypothetical protein
MSRETMADVGSGRFIVDSETVTAVATATYTARLPIFIMRQVSSTSSRPCTDGFVDQSTRSEPTSNTVIAMRLPRKTRLCNETQPTDFNNLLTFPARSRKKKR